MENKRKTLIILTPGFAANEADSTCIPVQQTLVKALKKTDPDLNIVVLAFEYPFISKVYYWHGIKVIAFGSPGNGRVHRWYSVLRIWRTLRRLNRNQNVIGLLSCWAGKCAVIGSKFAKSYGIKHYAWIWGQDARPGNKYISRINPRGEELIALSDFLAREFEKNYNIKPRHIIPMGIDAGLFSAVNTTRDIDIAGAGSLIPLKQYEVFLEVVALLKPAFPHIKTIICGEGQQRKHLEQLIKNLDISNQVVLVGEQPHAQVLAYMQRAKIFLHPSNYEGFCAVSLEALYAGAKVVSFVQPMDAAIPNWHIAADKMQMAEITKQLLTDKNLTHQPLLPYNMHDSVRAIMQLFEG